jgi:UDP-4-amino-4,6-dideoxy-N-acetyl-beta-L-altrosamine transaminase
MIPYSRQKIWKSDKNNVLRLLESDFLTQGDTHKLFEKFIAKKVNAKYCVSLNSATSALHLSCLALGLKKNDLFWTVPNSFVATSNCALYCGATVDFVDIDPITFNISLENLSKKLFLASKKKKIPKILTIVHMAGLATNLDEIYRLSRQYNFKIIEDASHALGSKYKGESVGSCRWSDITVFSFHPVKIITTGEGGAITTNNRKLAEQINSLRSHGIVKKSNKKSFINKPWYYEQISLGYNYRMSDLNASLGISQLKRIDLIINRRNLISRNYIKLLKNLPISFQKIPKNCLSAYHLFIIKINFKIVKNSYKKIFNFLIKKGIRVQLHYMPIYSHPFYKKFNYKKKNYPNTEEYSNSVISIPNYYDLNMKKQLYIFKNLKKILV